ncbi:MAG: acyl carrier protein [Thermodesulfovibrio sp.]|nr:acyl carrier protein [Thermodesulfovibrio sp.]
MAEPVHDQIRNIVADLFLMSLEEITPESSPSTIENWDSMQHLNLVLAVEQTFGIQLLPEDIERMTDVGMIERVVGEKLP